MKTDKKFELVVGDHTIAVSEADIEKFNDVIFSSKLEDVYAVKIEKLINKTKRNDAYSAMMQNDVMKGFVIDAANAAHENRRKLSTKEMVSRVFTDLKDLFGEFIEDYVDDEEFSGNYDEVLKFATDLFIKAATECARKDRNGKRTVLTFVNYISEVASVDLYLYDAIFDDYEYEDDAEDDEESTEDDE